METIRTNMRDGFENVETTGNIILQIDSSFGENSNSIIQNLLDNGCINTVTTTRNIEGISGLSVNLISSTNNKFKTSNSVKIQYEREVVNGYKLRAGASFSDSKVSLETIITSSDGVGFGIEFIASLFPLKLGFYNVIAIPAFEMHFVLKYNPITQDLIIIIRKSFSFDDKRNSDDFDQGKDDDDEDAAECGCEVEYVTVDVIDEIIYYRLISIPIESNEKKGVCNSMSEIGVELVERINNLRKYVMGPSSIELEKKKQRILKLKKIKERREEVTNMRRKIERRKLTEEKKKIEEEYEQKEPILVREIVRKREIRRPIKTAVKEEVPEAYESRSYYAYEEDEDLLLA